VTLPSSTPPTGGLHPNPEAPATLAETHVRAALALVASILARAEREEDDHGRA
jgi:hypothetical protein